MRPGSSIGYRFEFVRHQKHEELFLFRHVDKPAGQDRGQSGSFLAHDAFGWVLMSSKQGRAERDFLWQKYHRTAHVMADDVIEEEPEDDE